MRIMRKSRDGENTKETVLSAAKSLFAEYGYSATSLAMIAEKSGISDGLILHHFKTKKNLYHMVLEDLAHDYSQLFASSGQTSGDFAGQAANMLASAFQFWSDDAVYNRISMWAYLENQPEMVEEEAKLTIHLAHMLADLQVKGIVTPEISPMVLLTFVIGPIHFWMRYRDQFQNSFDLAESREQLDDLFLRQFNQMILKSFKA
jgi:AcrR family transcriptional regulator